MHGKHFKFAVSSLSCTPASIFQPHTVILPRYATHGTIKRLVHMRSVLKNIIPETQFTTSLHVGYNLDTPLALQELKRHHMLISSVDTPDMVPLPLFLFQLAKNCFFETSLKKIKNTVGWQFASVMDREKYQLKVSEGIASINTNESLHLIRAGTGAWYRSSVGKMLIEMITRKRKQIPTLALALEIDAKHQTPEEYFQFVYELNKSTNIPVYFDLDVGHIAEARRVHRYHRIEKSEILVERLLNNKKYSQLIGMISLNQYDHAKDETHISLLKGSINYVEIMRLLGEAGRAGHLSVDPIVMAEFSPFEYNEMTSLNGIRYINSLKRAYYASNSSMRAVLNPTTTSSSIQS